jgi:hypothetical protein
MCKIDILGDVPAASETFHEYFRDGNVMIYSVQ